MITTVRKAAVQDNNREQIGYVPSPAEIRAACREIRREWSDDEREQRCVRGNSLTRLSRSLQDIALD